MPVEQAEQHRQPLAHDPLVVGEQHADRVAAAAHRRHEELDAEAVGGRRGGEAPAEQLRALAHPRQPVAEAGLALPFAGGVASAVLDGQPRAVGRVAQP